MKHMVAHRGRSIAAIERALALLEALNRRPIMALSDLADTAKLPKATAVRLLDALIAGGYVYRLPRRGGYALSERVLRLAGGYRHSDRVVEAARPYLSALTAEHRWPFGVATLDGSAMRMRIFTIGESPFSTDPDYTNRRLSLAFSAVGRAYLAFCPAQERQLLFTMLKKSSASGRRSPYDFQRLGNTARSTRARGYAVSEDHGGDINRGISVPINSGDKVLACLTVRYLSTVYTQRQASERFLRPLKRTSALIVSTIQDNQ